MVNVKLILTIIAIVISLVVLICGGIYVFRTMKGKKNDSTALPDTGTEPLPPSNENIAFPPISNISVEKSLSGGKQNFSAASIEKVNDPFTNISNSPVKPNIKNSFDIHLLDDLNEEFNDHAEEESPTETLTPSDDKIMYAINDDEEIHEIDDIPFSMEDIHVDIDINDLHAENEFMSPLPTVVVISRKTTLTPQTTSKNKVEVIEERTINNAYITGDQQPSTENIVEETHQPETLKLREDIDLSFIVDDSNEHVDNSEDETVEEPTVNEVLDKPVETHADEQPLEENVKPPVEQPITNEVLNQPLSEFIDDVVNTHVDEPADKEVSIQPLEENVEPPVEQPITNPSVDELINDDELSNIITELKALDEEESSNDQPEEDADEEDNAEEDNGSEPSSGDEEQPLVDKNEIESLDLSAE